MTTTAVTDVRISPEHARQELVDHRFYRYRGCAPDPDQPGRAAGNPALPLDAWEGADIDGPENPKDRHQRQVAAVEVCVECPVRVQCLAYARTYRIETGVDGTQKAVLAIPSGIMGGLTALERHREFIAAHHRIAITPAPDARLRTQQKLAVVAALAANSGPEEVAAAAGMDVRTANWHRSTLATLLGLNRKTATRRALLAAAVERGLLDAGQVVDDDGTVPAVPRPAQRARTTATQATDHTASARPLPSRPASGRPAGRPRGRGRVLRVLRSPRIHAVDGQLELPLDLHPMTSGPGATVHALPLPARTLGAAA